jgi:predicted alpha/beta-fold hydrolase
MRTAEALCANSEDHIVDCGEGVRLLVHHTPPADNAIGKVAVLIHGWEGSGMSTYILSVATKLWNAGYRVVRLNLRDHGRSHHLNEGLFHSCRLAEATGAVQWVQTRFPNDALLLAGFSLGGNFSLRIGAATRESGLQIERVVAVCPVLNPKETLSALDAGFPVYRAYYIRKWKRSLIRKKAAFPDLYDFSNLQRFTSLTDMTDFFVRHYTEYQSLDTYLDGYTLTGNRLANLTVPSRILLVDDDPIIPARTLEDVAQPDSLIVERSPYGGHCGFISSYRLQSWLDDYFPDAFETTEESVADSAFGA